jgi:hypothetical protein
VSRGGGGGLTGVEQTGLAVGLVLAAGLMWPLRGYLTDDTFIHLQYARHLAAGRGLVFNLGERVYGCTSPLWAAWLAVGMRLGLEGLGWARVSGCAATLASVVVFLGLLRRTVPTPAVRAAATVAWAGHAWMLRWSVSGMETPLAVLLVLAGFSAFRGDGEPGERPARTGTLWALAALTRPEASVLLLLWGASLISAAENREGVRRLIAGSLPPVLLYGGWLLWAYLYYGTVWPSTLAAKAAGGTALEFQLENLRRPLELVGATDGALLAALALALGFGGRAVWTSAGFGAPSLVPWVWVLVLPALYVGRGVPVLSRYLLPLSPVLAWLAWRAVNAWWLGLGAAPAASRRVGWLGAALATIVLAQNLAVFRGAVIPHVRTFSPALERSLVRWGTWFHDHTAQAAVIAAPDIGMIGYFSGRRVVDLAGLVTPQMVPFLNREAPEEAVARFRFAEFSRPDFLVDRSDAPGALRRRSPYGPCLTTLGSAGVPNLGIARPHPAVYTLYRVDWAVFDSLKTVPPR